MQVEILFVLMVIVVALFVVGEGGEAGDGEAATAAALGEAEDALIALGHPAEAVKDKSQTELTALLSKAAKDQKAHQDKTGKESVDIAATLGRMEKILEGAITKPEGTIVDGAVMLPDDDEPVVRKGEHPEHASDEPGSAMERKSLLDLLGQADLWFQPGPEALIGAPVEQAKELHDMSDAHVRAMRQLNDNIVLTTSLMQQAGPPHMRGAAWETVARSLKQYGLFRDELKRNAALAKALDTATAAEGAEFVPTEFSRELFDRVEYEANLASLFRTIPMPQSPFTLPIRGTRPTAYLAAQSLIDASASLTATDAGTANLTLTAVKLAVRILFSDELDEDSVVPILPFVESEMVEALAHGIENALINGDTQGTHFDTGDTVAATDVRRCWIGLRRLQNQQTSPIALVDFSTPSTDAALNLKGEMLQYGTKNPSRGVWICSTKSLIELMKLDECLTVDRYGAKATIHEGELAQFFGSPVVVSEHVRQDLNTAGIYDGCVETDTILLYAYTPACVFGRRSSKVESDRIVETQQTQVVSVLRMDFGPLYAQATNPIVGLGNSLTV